MAEPKRCTAAVATAAAKPAKYHRVPQGIRVARVERKRNPGLSLGVDRRTPDFADAQSGLRLLAFGRLRLIMVWMTANDHLGPYQFLVRFKHLATRAYDDPDRDAASDERVKERIAG